MGGVSETHASHLHLEVLSNTAQPGPSLPLILLSLAWVSFLKVGKHLRAHLNLIYIPPPHFTFIHLLVPVPGVLSLILLPVPFLPSSAKPRASSASSVRMRMTSSSLLSSINAGPVKVRAGARCGVGR